jgi:hypothetical protein
MLLRAFKVRSPFECSIPRENGRGNDFGRSGWTRTDELCCFAAQFTSAYNLERFVCADNTPAFGTNLQARFGEHNVINKSPL